MNISVNDQAWEQRMQTSDFLKEEKTVVKLITEGLGFTSVGKVLATQA